MPQTKRPPTGRPRQQVSGDITARVTPVPIPNTAVKPRRADCTARETVWESRSSPALNKGSVEKSTEPFPFWETKPHADLHESSTDSRRPTPGSGPRFSDPCNFRLIRGGFGFSRNV